MIMKGIVDSSAGAIRSSHSNALEALERQHIDLEGKIESIPNPLLVLKISTEQEGVHQLIKLAYIDALATYRGNKKQLAKDLGISRGKLYRRLEQYGIY